MLPSAQGAPWRLKLHIAVIGHSDSSGLLLAPPARPWPALLQDRLADELGEPVVVDSLRFAPYRPRSVDYAIDLVKKSEPDVVIIPLAAYWCSFPTVHYSVERRFGQRAARWYMRSEERFTKRFEHRGTDRSQTIPVARKLTRRLLGAAAPLTVDELIDRFSSLIRTLCQQEHLQILGMGDHHFNARVRAALPRLEPDIARIQAAIRPLLAERHMLWADQEELMNVGGRREEMIGPDGVHMTPESHERIAAGLTPILAEAWRAR